MFTESCKTCGWVSKPKDTPGKARLALSLHTHRAHTGKVMTIGQHQLGRKRRPYVRRKQQPETDPDRQTWDTIGQKAVINFCPGCGFDLHKVAVGIVLANKMKQ